MNIVQWPVNKSTPFKVMGVGGGGGTAVNYMYLHGIHGVSFAVCNTDAYSLDLSPVPEKIQMGNQDLCCNPESGNKAALESSDKIRKSLGTGTEMLFLVAGMGGCTGSGATPVIARIAKELGILTVAVVTTPFFFEGSNVIRQAKESINELKNHVDSLIIINNEKMHEVYGELTISKIFRKSDQMLMMAVKSIAEMITIQGVFNIDLKDVKTILSNSGITVAGSGSASGKNRACNAVENALHSTLFYNNYNINDARRIMFKVMSGSGKNELIMDEASEILKVVTGSNNKASLIWGAGIDESLGDAISVNIIITDFISNQNLINVNHNK